MLAFSLRACLEESTYSLLSRKAPYSFKSFMIIWFRYFADSLFYEKKITKF